jgi:hypothetical protein
VPFWKEGTINRQLTTLGSSLRLVVVGAQFSRLSHLCVSSGQDATIRGQFIFGGISPVTVQQNAPLFEFEYEFATSPFLKSGAVAFTEARRIVLRHVPLSIDVHSNKAGGGHDYVDKTFLFHIRRRAVLAHESRHALDLYGPLMYEERRAIIRSDICRYLQHPRTLEDLQLTFGSCFADDVEAGGSSLEEQLSDLEGAGVISKSLEGRLYCPEYEAGRIWVVA